MRRLTVYVGLLSGWILGIHIAPEYPRAPLQPVSPSGLLVQPLAPLPSERITEAQQALSYAGLPFFNLFRFETTFPDCSSGLSVCIVQESPGGHLYAFESAAWQVTAGARSLVVIDGPCSSGCVVFADYARSRVCITERADFRLHKGRKYVLEKIENVEIQVFKEYFDPPHSADILTWVAAHGGFPETTMLSMSYAEAKTFWRTCKLRVPLPKPRPAKI